MRSLFAAAFILLFYSAFSQELIFSSMPKPGIYKNFYEFKYNRPSIEFEYDVFEKPIQTLNDSYIFYGVRLDKKDTLLPKSMFGFCIGGNVYLNLTRGAPVYRSGFVKTEFLGRYCIFKTIKDGGMGAYGVTIQTSYIVTYVLDVIDGKKFPLTATVVDDMIKDDRELLDAYKQENRKDPVAEEYVINYCKRNLSRHILKPVINDSTLCKMESDSSFKDYYQRIIDFGIDTAIIDVELRKYYYGKNKLKVIGLKAKHKQGKNEDYFYKIGTWRSFHRNENLKELVNYDFREKENGKSLFYNNEGILIGEKNFLHGKEIK